MDKFPTPDLWWVYSLPERHKDEFLKITEESIKKTQNSQETLNLITQLASEKLKRLLPELFESHFEMQPRAAAARKFITHEIVKIEGEIGRKLEDFELMVVTHSSFIKQITSTIYDEKTGFGVDGRWPENAQILEYELDLDENFWRNKFFNWNHYSESLNEENPFEVSIF